MKKKYSLILIFLTSFIYSQKTTLKGYILNKNQSDSLPYVSLKIINKGIGTVSMDNGFFNLNLSNVSRNDTIKFSSLGFKSLFYCVKDLEKRLSTSLNLFMEENSLELNEIVLMTKKKWKQKRFGSKFESKKIGLGFPAKLGSELGRIIRVRSKEYNELLEFRANISFNTYKEIKFRLNFYTLNNNMPGKKINTKNIYLNFKEKNGPLIVDLRDYDLIVSDDFFVSLEFIDDYSDKGTFRIAARPGLSNIRRRDNLPPFDWEKFPIPISMAYSVLIKY
jgi:hypothetical protein